MVTIKYGDDLFYPEGSYDDVCKALADDRSLRVRRHPESTKWYEITFHNNVDWVAVEL